MDIKTIILFLTTGVNFGLALAILFKYKSAFARNFTYMLLSISLWSLFIGLFRLSTNTLELAIFSKLYYVFAALISYYFFIFCKLIPPSLKINTLLSSLPVIIITVCVLLMVSVFHTVTDLRVGIDGTHTAVIIPLNYIIYSVYFFSLLFLSFYLLIVKRRLAVSQHLKTISVVFWSTLLAASFGTIFNLVAPIWTYEYIWIGPPFTMLVAIVLGYTLFVESSVYES